MVSVNTHKTNIKLYYDIRLLSTDTKPTKNIPNGSTCVEMDTGKIYFYDSENATWREM